MGKNRSHPKEHMQVRTAIVLLTYTILVGFATLALFCGIAAWVKHLGLWPKHHTLGAASIWRLEQIQRLAQSPHCRRRQVLHSDFGGESAEPTGLLLLRLTEFETHERTRECKVAPHQAAERKK